MVLAISGLGPAILGRLSDLVCICMYFQVTRYVCVVRTQESVVACMSGQHIETKIEQGGMLGDVMRCDATQRNGENRYECLNDA